MLLLHYELPMGFRPSASSSTSKTINASEDFEAKAYIDIQSYNKQNKISKNCHNTNKK